MLSEGFLCAAGTQQQAESGLGEKDSTFLPASIGGSCPANNADIPEECSGIWATTGLTPSGSARLVCQQAPQKLSFIVLLA